MSAQRRWSLLSASIVLLLLGTSVTRAEEEGRPNIVILLSDNLGYGELGSYGGGVLRGSPTPRLDALAKEGLRLTNFNVEVECTPSRSALMTGRMPIRSGTWRAGTPGLPGGLAPWEVTIAETLSDAGYATAIFGKWHLGDTEGRFPTNQGFDTWWGFPFSTNVAMDTAAVGFDPVVAGVPHLLEGEAGEPVREVEPYTLANRPLIDGRIAEKSVAWIAEQAEGERPFFLFVSWSNPHHPYLPHPDFAGKSGNGDYADVIVEHDHRVGQVLDAIDAAGITEDTIVFYMSDNGPDSAHYPQVSNSGPFRGYLGSAFEGSIRTPAFLRWPGRVPAGRVSNEIVALVDVFPSLATFVGVDMPSGRVIDGVDQSAFFAGETETSAREHALFFSGRTLLAAKWRRFKVFFTGDDPSPQDRAWRRLWAPLVFNVEQDPREEVDRFFYNMWLLEPVLTKVYEFLFTVDGEGLILPGGTRPEDATVEIPFQSQGEIEKSMGAIKRRFIKRKVQETLGLGGDDAR
ncbi:MAG: arylsulfatase [Myxococcota bacterium]